MSEISIAAVVPTIGRDSLRRTIDSILEQNYPVSELVVVNDSQAQIPLVKDEAVKGVPVVEVYTGGLTGEGNARNVGVRSATASHVAYLDDDDVWLPHHLKMAVRSLRGPAGPDVYSCSAILARPDGARICPKVRYTGHRPLIDFFYGAWSWAGRERGIPCTSWVFRRELGLEFPMDSALTSSPDMWWLLQLAAAGHTIWQSSAPGTIWFEDPARTASRGTLDFWLDWAHRLESLRSGAGRRWLVHTVGRRLARAGDTAEWRKLMDVVDDQFRLTQGERAVRALEAILLAARPRSSAPQ
jgi:glycosyltransferase involved in cell wall biosynthesis